MSLVAVSGEVIVAAFLFVFVTMAFIVFIYMYRRNSGSSGRHVHVQFVSGLNQEPPTALRRGLDPAAIHSLPVVVYKLQDFKETVECAVCLSELANGDKARLLPKCNHGFHLQCIDEWFRSNSTCPLCRNPVEAMLTDGSSKEAFVLPRNMLFWGTEDHVSSGSRDLLQGSTTSSLPSSSSEKFQGALMIDIPSGMVEGMPSPLPASMFPAENMKTPTAPAVTTPTSTRLRSFKRLLSREKKVGGSSCSPCEGDIEQGAARADE